MTTTAAGKKITRTTIKMFIARQMAANNLYTKQISHFDGMVDCVMPCEGASWVAASTTDRNVENTLGVSGIWLVGGSRDYFTEYADDNFIGYEIYNCCGSSLVAMKRLY